MEVSKRRTFLTKSKNAIDQVCIHPNTVIPTNFNFSSNAFKIEIKFIPLNYNYSNMFESYRGGQNFGSQIFGNTILYDYLGSSRRIGSLGNPSTGLSTISNEDNVCIFDNVGYTLNGQQIKFGNTTIPSLASSYQLYIGLSKEQYPTSIWSKFILKYFKLWQNDIMCLDIIPWKDNNEYCLYDKVGKSVLKSLYGTITHDFND